VALLLLALVFMHACAALYHHFVRRDDVLRGMLPGQRHYSARRDLSEV
jgi:cytochrome b561